MSTHRLIADFVVPWSASSLAGALMWLWFGDFRIEEEGWDDPAYFTIGVPCLVALCFLAALLLRPPDPWWAIGPAAAQCALCFLSPVDNTLWPITVGAFGVLSVPCVLAAWGGSHDGAFMMRAHAKPRRAP